jgi:hypothetical protein
VKVGDIVRHLLYPGRRFRVLRVEDTKVDCRDVSYGHARFFDPRQLRVDRKATKEARSRAEGGS